MGTSIFETMIAWAVILIPFILFDIAAIKWGVYTSGDHSLPTSLEV